MIIPQVPCKTARSETQPSYRHQGNASTGRILSRVRSQMGGKRRSLMPRSKILIQRSSKDMISPFQDELSQSSLQKSNPQLVTALTADCNDEEEIMKPLPTNMGEQASLQRAIKIPGRSIMLGGEWKGIGVLPQSFPSLKRWFSLVVSLLLDSIKCFRPKGLC